MLRTCVGDVKGNCPLAALHGPAMKSVEAVGEAGREGARLRSGGPPARLNRIDEGTMVVTSGFFDAVIVER
jgi:hypothetical protein